MLSQKEKQIIDNIAYQLSEIVFGDKNRTEYPLAQALEDIGIQIRYFVDQQFSGYLEWDPSLNYGEGGPVISINATHSVGRMNFSMAHELGHLVLGYKWLPAPYGELTNLFEKRKILNVTKYRGGQINSPKQKVEEQKVDEFAAAFLMPKKTINQLFEAENRDIEKTIIRMSNDLAVSKQAARIRMRDFLKEENYDY